MGHCYLLTVTSRIERKGAFNEKPSLGKGNIINDGLDNTSMTHTMRKDILEDRKNNNEEILRHLPLNGLRVATNIGSKKLHHNLQLIQVLLM